MDFLMSSNLIYILVFHLGFMWLQGAPLECGRSVILRHYSDLRVSCP
jgi:hypothetical protein